MLLLFECLQRTVTQFIGAHKGFVEERCRATCIETLGIKRFQGIEIELPLQVFCRVLPTLQRRFIARFLVDDADRINTFVHANGVFPIVSTLRKLAVIFDTHGLIGTHVACHHLLFHTSYLRSWGVNGISSFANAIA